MLCYVILSYVMYACMHVCMYVYTLRVLGMTYPLENDSDLLHVIAVSTELVGRIIIQF